MVKCRKLAAVLAAAACLASQGARAQTNQVFYDSFDTKGGLGSAWQISSWVNGHPFGCTFSSQDVSKSKGMLSLSFSGSSGKCAEVRTAKAWQYGSFIVNMQPANVGGTISSFFLYTGTAGTASHFEIDIEFMGGTSTLHTNYWVAGQQNPLDIDLAQYGINPYGGMRNYSIEWRPDSIAWFAYSDAGQWVELRRVATGAVAVPMQLMMNAWYGDNQDWAVYFPGYYNGEAGVAKYGSVWIGK
ncbi:Glycosyl hydrolases family 16 [Noviherbaspirillum humi]|uniref:Beta-glucanase n=1 Tax=Noviherbaspirillum humi TaxID=1688639 RepID=A0A239DPF7_9BURK|nr:family 16 glycosylhydrolase [Noviherbaspirillum humi]SNS33494.1 Glycosyl hydrolases family 16 [Noviherbaspirillum humi]